MNGPATRADMTRALVASRDLETDFGATDIAKFHGR